MAGRIPNNNPNGPKRRGRRPASIPDWAPYFIGALMEGASVRKACKIAKVDITTPYERRKRDPEFVAAWREASDIGTEFLEQEAQRRAYHGTLKPQFYKGSKCGVVREYSDTLMIFMLKARKPETYRDNCDDGEQRGNVVVNIQVIAVEDTNKPDRSVIEVPVLGNGHRQNGQSLS